MGHFPPLLYTFGHSIWMSPGLALAETERKIGRTISSQLPCEEYPEYATLQANPSC